MSKFKPNPKIKRITLDGKEILKDINENSDAPSMINGGIIEGVKDWVVRGDEIATDVNKEFKEYINNPKNLFWLDAETGNKYDFETGELIGNINDEK